MIQLLTTQTYRLPILPHYLITHVIVKQESPLTQNVSATRQQWVYEGPW